MSGRHNGRGGLRGEIDELMGENCEEREKKERIDHSKIASSVLRIGKNKKKGENTQHATKISAIGISDMEPLSLNRAN